MTMFSNLHTEAGHWNHLFIPEAVRIFTYQDHPLLIIASDDSALEESTRNGVPLVPFELGRYLRSHPGTTATYATTDARGETIRTAGPAPDSSIATRIVNKIAKFQTVSPPGRGGADHHAHDRGRRSGLADSLAGVTEIAHDELQPGDRLFCISAGVVEPHRPGVEEFGQERLIALLSEQSRVGLDAAETVRRLSHTVLDHHGVLSDDTTAFLIDLHYRLTVPGTSHCLSPE